ncbi:UDP-N-acetylmuramoyl-tripeptide--D-alanyl-D-alanine ligase [Bacillus sp. FJAT-50079]|nr:UDP-N-acetylmuramoyl-tripeptide--D-alanyl-D-alanine ligase [Bacillus sp. FJAT-50079]
MNSLSVKQVRTILSGKLIQGSDDVMIHHGAYRLKQIKHPHTIFFARANIVNWEQLKNFFPLVLVTSRDFSVDNQLRDLTVIKVEDVEKAYWQFVHYYRSLFDLPIIAITGTSGKTTTKEMIRHILSFDKTITATNNTNNSRTAHLQYLLSIDHDTEAAVIEAAVGAPGDVLRAGEYFKPTIGIITNIGAHHLNYCKTPEAYIAAKGEMIEALHHEGVLIINADDVNSKKLDLTNYRGRIIKVGTSQGCDFKAENIHYWQNGMKFTLVHKKQQYPLFVPGFGGHQVYNALSTLAAVYEVGMNIPEAAKRLASFQNLNKHLQMHEGINQSTILDDTWSITTTSLEAALKVINEIGKDKKKIAILGTLTDLGSWGYVIHEKAGEIIHRIGVDVLITIGMHAKIMADQAVKLGLQAEVYTFQNSTLVYNLLERLTDEHTIILIKGDMYSTPIIELARNIRKKQ